MLFNKNIILEILRRNFADELETCINDSIANIDPDERVEIFDSWIDYTLMDLIEDISVESYSVENRTDEQVVSGVLSVLAIADGYVHWEGEDVFVDADEIEVMFSFSFHVKDSKFSKFSLIPVR